MTVLFPLKGNVPSTSSSLFFCVVNFFYNPFLTAGCMYLIVINIQINAPEQHGNGLGELSRKKQEEIVNIFYKSAQYYDGHQDEIC